MHLKSLEPVEHRPVYKRVDLNPVRKAPFNFDVAPPAWKLEAERQRCERIWQITKQTAIGTNAPAVEPVTVPADVDMSGWDAA